MGPTAVFLPPRKGRVPESAAIPAAAALTAPAYAQAAAMGRQSSWPRHAEVLARSSPHHGTWSEQEVPDGLSARQALALVRSAASDRLLGAPA